MHFLGLAGMPRRIPDYSDLYSLLNFVETIGATVSIIATFLFFVIIFLSIDGFRVLYLFKFYATRGLLFLTALTPANYRLIF
jgi:heme/copper-type cytochrome/quinol oxidase subunit 1